MTSSAEPRAVVPGIVTRLDAGDWAYLAVVVPTLASGVVYLLPGTLEHPHIHWLVELQITLLALATLGHAARVLSPARALSFFMSSLLLTWLVESRPARQLMFGAGYDYAPLMGHCLPGDVPLMIPLAWFGICYVALLYVRAVTPSAGNNGPRLWHYALWGGYTVCVMDLLLDPIATAAGAYTWHDPGFYFTTPWENYVGWFAVGGLVFAGDHVVTRTMGGAAAADAITRRERIARTVSYGAWLPPMILAAEQGRAAAAVVFLLGMLPLAIVALRTRSPVRFG